MTMLEIIIIAGFGLLLGLNLGVGLGYFWCFKHKQKEDTPIMTTQTAEVVETPAETQKSTFWQQSADNLE